MTSGLHSSEGDAFRVNHTIAELYLGGDQIALAGIQLQTVLAAEFEHKLQSFDDIVCIFRIIELVFEPDEQVPVPEQCLHCELEVRNGIHGTVKNAVRRGGCASTHI